MHKGHRTLINFLLLELINNFDSLRNFAIFTLHSIHVSATSTVFMIVGFGQNNNLQSQTGSSRGIHPV